MPFRGRAKRGHAKRRRPRKHRRVRKGRKANLPKQVHQIKKQVKALRIQADNATSTLVYRERFIETVLPEDNEVDFTSMSLSSIFGIKRALVNVSYFDPSSPSTLIVADLDAPAYQQKILFKSLHGNMTCRNNYVVPCRCTIYLWLPKFMTSLEPLSIYTVGMIDQGNPDINDPLVFPTDCIQLKYLWKLKKHQTRILQPGQQMKMSHSAAPFNYDPSFNDTENHDFYPQWGGASWFVRVTGLVAHAGASTELGTSACGVDCMFDTTYKIEYNSGGADLNQIIIANASATPASTFVQSNKPLAGNQSFTFGPGI